MCTCSISSEWTSAAFAFYIQKARSKKRCRVRIQGLNRRTKRSTKLKTVNDHMKENNLKLYMENLAIFQENEKLRKKATFLHQENLRLMSELKHSQKHCLLPAQTVQDQQQLYQ